MIGWRVTAVCAVLMLLAACSGSPKTPTPTPKSTRADATTKLAYVHAGDIYVQGLPAGSPQRLTNDGTNHSPKWSPSGDWLLFSTAGANFVARSDGSGRRQVTATSWAPSSDVLVSMDDRGTVVVENADGSDHREIATPAAGAAGPELRGFSAALSPDGAWIAYAKMTVNPANVPGFVYDGIWRMRVDGSDAQELYNTGDPPYDGLVLLGWSADSRHILFERDIAHSASAIADGLPLETISLDGGSPQQITAGMLAGLGFESQPSGALVAITDGSGRETWTNKRIATLDPATGTDTPLTGATEAALSPSWSPDGSQLAYTSAPAVSDVGGGDPAREAMAQRRIWIMNADGTNKHQVTGDAAYRDERPLWSVDGSEIIFARIDANHGASLWTVPSAGGIPRQIVDDLSPNPESGSPFWFGYYGKIDWDALFDVR